MTIRLSVNIDHVATLRQARCVGYPDPIQAAFKAIRGGADGITLHLREDRRHIQDADVFSFKEMLNVPMNLEIALTEEMLSIAESVQPTHVCFVPETRRELKTEGGLDLVSHTELFSDACARLMEAHVTTSLFIDPDKSQIDAAKRCGAQVIELHTGAYVDAKTPAESREELKRIIEAADYAHHLGFVVNAGHGLHIENVQAIAAIPVINELNIGYSIVTRALFIGMQRAVEEMKALMIAARTVEPVATV